MLTKLYNGNPNTREVRRIADILRDGKVVIMPTDTLYAFACCMDQKRAVESIAEKDLPSSAMRTPAALNSGSVSAVIRPFLSSR